MTDKELAALANARYPDVPLLLAIDFFMSDRRQAGLGALGVERRKRFGAMGYSHSKEMNHFDGRIFYRSAYRQKERLRYKPMPLMDYTHISQRATIETERVPSIDEVRAMPIDYKDFSTQAGRRYVARCLRGLRKEIRAAAKIGKTK